MNRADAVLPRPDSVTVLRTSEPWFTANKKLTIDGNTKTRADIGSLFSVTKCPIKTVDDLEAVVSCGEQDPRSFIIRGELNSSLDPTALHYRRNANFGDHLRHWAMLDFDEVPAPPGLRPTETAAVEWLIRERLPACFQDAQLVAQWSGSAGTAKAGDLIKVHLFCLFEQAQSNADLKWWAREIGADWRVFQQVQVHYIARPQFVDGLDPLPVRTFRVGSGRQLVPFVPNRLSRPRFYTTATAPATPTSTDAGGKITDGRENVLRNAVWQAAQTLRREGLPVSAETISERAWGAFAAACDLSDGKWQFADCERRAEALAAKNERGDVRLPAETRGLGPHWQLSTQAVTAVRAILAQIVEEFFHAG